MYDLRKITKKVNFYILKDTIGTVAVEYVVLLALTSVIASGVGLKIQEKTETAVSNIELATSGLASGGGGEASDGKDGKGGKKDKGGKGGKKDKGGKGGKGGKK